MNKVQLRRFLADSFASWPDWFTSSAAVLLAIIAIVVVAFAAYRLWHVIRQGANSLDAVAVSLGGAVFGNWLSETYWHDAETWLGAGAGLVAGVLICRQHPWWLVGFPCRRR